MLVSSLSHLHSHWNGTWQDRRSWLLSGNACFNDTQSQDERLAVGGKMEGEFGDALTCPWNTLIIMAMLINKVHMCTSLHVLMCVLFLLNGLSSRDIRPPSLSSHPYLFLSLWASITWKNKDMGMQRRNNMTHLYYAILVMQWEIKKCIFVGITSILPCKNIWLGHP